MKARLKSLIDDHKNIWDIRLICQIRFFNGHSKDGFNARKIDVFSSKNVPGQECISNPLWHGA
jgi:hypothetical protein